MPGVCGLYPNYVQKEIIKGDERLKYFTNGLIPLADKPRRLPATVDNIGDLSHQ
jgi:hypothetical protein